MKKLCVGWVAFLALALGSCATGADVAEPGDSLEDLDGHSDGSGAGGSGASTEGGAGASGEGSGGSDGGASGGSGGQAGSSGGAAGGASRRDASQDPPGGLRPDQVPMFVSIGWDDNAYSGLVGSGGDGAMAWSTDFIREWVNPSGKGNAGTFDGSPARVSYYMTAVYISSWMSESPAYVKRAWRTAFDDGHEIGNHTEHHGHGAAFKLEEWTAEVRAATDWLTRPFDPDEVSHTPDDTKGIGLDARDITGFRTPFLEYNDATLSAVQQAGLHYDCSIEEGYQWDQDGTNYNWPYTLDNGSPGHEVQLAWPGTTKTPISPKAGLWEMPVYALIIPPDAVAGEYGFAPGLRGRIKEKLNWWDADAGKFTGFDYNLWVQADLTQDEFVATLKYSFDLRLSGNRAPFMFGAHTDYYSSKYTAPKNTTAAERREAVEEFVRYVLTKPDVRVVPTQKVLEWLKNPVVL